MKLMMVPMVGGRGIGPICRTLAIAEEAKRFFEIKFLCSNKFVPFLQDREYSFVEDVDPVQVQEQGDIIKWNDAAYAMGLCNPTFVEKAISHQLQIVKEYEPDVIFTEYNLTICVVAKILNIPIVSTIHWADVSEFSIGKTHLPNKYPHAIDPYNDFLTRYGFCTYGDISQMVTEIPILIAPTLECLQPKLKNYGATYVGELINREWEEDEKVEDTIEKDCVYVYLTTADIPIETWVKRVFIELGNKPFKVYMVGNDKVMRFIHNDNIEIPSNICVSNYYPSMSVLKKAKIVIHAGSSNIISGALLTATPSLMLPLNDGERLFNALGVERNGCGKIIRENEFLTPGVLSHMVEKYSSDYYAQNSMALGTEIKNLGGRNRTVEIMKNIVKHSEVI